MRAGLVPSGLGAALVVMLLVWLWEATRCDRTHPRQKPSLGPMKGMSGIHE